MEYNPKISIITPVYKAEQYISQCIDSVLNQTYRNMEIILVDDGSPDSCGKICDGYAQKDARIKVVHKENGGTSSARNAGLDNSSGEWIAFIDADDWFEEDALEKLVAIAGQTDAEIVGFNHFYNQNSRQWKRAAIKPNPLLRQGEIGKKWLTLAAIFPHYDAVKNKMELGAIRGAWSKIFKRSIVANNHIRFDEKVAIVEDAVFCLDCFRHASKVAFVDEYLIHYRLYDDSKIRRFHRNIVDVNELTLERYHERIAQHLPTDEDYQVAFLGLSAGQLFQALKLNMLHKENKLPLLEKVEQIRKMLSSPMYDIAFRCKTLKYLPKGKKELVYCAQRKWCWGVYLVGLLSLWYLKVKK